MPQHLDLADLRETFDALATAKFSQRFSCVHHRDIQWRKIKRALPGRRLLKDQTFALRGVPRNLFSVLSHRFSATFYSGCSNARLTAATIRSISAREVVSVTQTKACFVNSG